MIGRREVRKKRTRATEAEERHLDGENGTKLAHLNALVEEAWHARLAPNMSSVSSGFLHESTWDTWLWGEDPLEEAPVSSTMLNRMQLLGLLIARYTCASCFVAKKHHDGDHVFCSIILETNIDALLFVRYRAAFQERFHTSTMTLADMISRVPGASPAAKQRLGGMFEKAAVKDLTLRQLRDATQNMQFHWNQLRVVETMQQPEITEVVDALFHRYIFGALCFSSSIH